MTLYKSSFPCMRTPIGDVRIDKSHPLYQHWYDDVRPVDTDKLWQILRDAQFPDPIETHATDLRLL